MILVQIQKLITDVIDWFYNPFKGIISITTFRYAATGGANTVLDILLYFIFYHFILVEQNLELGFVTISSHIAAFLLVFPITFSTGFMLAKYITFTASDLKGRIQLIRYALTVIGSILLNYILLKFFVEICGFYPVVSKMITTVVVIIYSYVAQRFFSFKTTVA